MKKIIVNIDGACEPINPGGVASYGFLIQKNGEILHKGKGVIGEGKGMTNNVAEYTAAIEAIKWIKENLEPEEIKLLSDSQLLIRQLKGEYAVKSNRIKPLYREIGKLLEKLESEVSFKWIPRDENQEADKLSKEAIEEYLKTEQAK